MQVVKQHKVPMNTNTVRRIHAKYLEFEPIYGKIARQYLETPQYDPERHASAAIGTLARVKQDNLTLWADISRNGWHPVQAWKDGEWIIRRDLWRLLTPEELHEECAEYFAQIGLIETDSSPQNSDAASFDPWGRSAPEEPK
jgi:hypothetical protein